VFTGAVIVFAVLLNSIQYAKRPARATSATPSQPSQSVSGA